ncbi:MAG TPA: type III-B CRISPR module RAMP protein Cmr6 [Chloroflexi bacterium]|nr:type III-B CRISPR module RAMP protein Cmr6 [Chloroflexota bacterium]
MLRSWNALVFEASPQWRLIVGLGRKGPLEVGFTFHRLYGVPIIPGSSLKGIARAYACLVLGKSEDDPDFCAIFGRGPDFEGGEGQAGRAVFFDAIPISEPHLELDVMNPHFPRYYQGDEAPSDWQSPVPIYFLTVGRETRFLFGVGWRGCWTMKPHGCVIWPPNGSEMVCRSWEPAPRPRRGTGFSER